MRFILSLLACTAIATPALAMQEPAPSKLDSRIRTASYSASNVLHVTSTNLSPIQIVFQEGEQFARFAGLRAATAKNAAEMANVHDWLVVPNGNSIMIQPLKAEKPSLLFVDTLAPDGTMRHYRLQIDTRDGSVGKDPAEYEAINMTYPSVVAAQRKAAWDADAPIRAQKEATREHKRQAAEAEWRLKAATLPTATGRNWRYEAQNIDAKDTSCSVIGPEHAAGISDDGLQTRLLFAPHAALPVPYVLDQDGKESVVQHSQDETADGLVMTLHAVVSKVILRRGDRVCSFTNLAYDPVGHQPGTGTISPDVIREIKQ